MIFNELQNFITGCQAISIRSLNAPAFLKSAPSTLVEWSSKSINMENPSTTSITHTTRFFLYQKTHNFTPLIPSLMCNFLSKAAIVRLPIAPLTSSWVSFECAKKRHCKGTGLRSELIAVSEMHEGPYLLLLSQNTSNMPMPDWLQVQRWPGVSFLVHLTHFFLFTHNEVFLLLLVILLDLLLLLQLVLLLTDVLHQSIDKNRYW